MEELFDDTKKLVRATIERLGVDPVTTLVKDGPEQASWTLQRGSASILVTVIRREGGKDTYFRVISPILAIPPGDGAASSMTDERQTSLFRRLLELNAGGLANCAFGLVGAKVVVVSERTARGLDAGEVDQMITHVAAVADTYDDRLIDEFGASRPPAARPES